MHRVLYVDDEDGLLEIGKIFLETTGQFGIDTVTSATGALTLLSGQAYDAIISDYQMPGMDGIAFLKQVRSMHGDIPFILFTGKGREDVVIDAINNGADFYLQKGGDPTAQFAELAHKLRQAIRRKETERSLYDSERRLSDIINFLPDATFVIDQDGRVIAWNRAIEEMTGVNASEMIGKGDCEYALPFYGTRRKILIDLIFESGEDLATYYAHIIREKDTLIADTNLPRLKGRAVTLMGKASPLYNRQGEIVGAIESIRDITALRQAGDELRAAYEQLTASDEQLRAQFEELALSEKRQKKSEAEISGLFHVAPVGIGVVSNRILLKVNERLCAMTGYSREEMEGRNTRFLYLNDVEYARAGEFYTLGSSPGTGKSLETRFLRKDGRVLDIRLYGTMIDPENPSAGNILTALDITEEKKTHEELRAAYEKISHSEEALRDQNENLSRTERDLRKSENEIATILYAAPVGIAVSVNRVLKRVNEHLCRITGYPREEMEGRNTRFVYPDDREYARVAEFYASAGRGESIETRFIRKDGTIRDIQLFGAGIDPENSDAGMIFTALDITERTQAERTLKVSEERTRRILEKEPLALGIVNYDGNVTFLNERFQRIFGYTMEDIPTIDAWWQRAYPDPSYQKEVKERWEREVRQSAENQQDIEPTEFTVTTKNGEERIIEIGGIAFEDGFLSTFVDITDRRQAEEELRASESNFRLITENMADQISRIDRNRILLYGSPSVERQTGYTLEEFIGTDAISYIHPEDRERVTREVREAIGRHDPTVRIEYRYHHKDGTYWWYESETRILYDAAGEYDGAIFASRGITRRKEVEDALRESEGKYRTLVESSFDGILIHQDGVLVSINQTAARLLGSEDPGIFIGRPALGFIAPAFRETVAERIRHSPKKAQELIREQLFRLDGSLIDADVMTAPVTWNGRPAAYVTFRDITSQVRAEEALRESEKQYRAIIENIQDLVYRTDKAGMLTMVNPAGARMMGYDSPDQLIGHPVAEVYANPGDRKALLEALGRDGSVYGYPLTLKSRDGTIRHVITSSHLYYDAGGVELGVEGVLHDITDLQRAEDALRMANKKLTLLSGITRHDIRNQLLQLDSYIQLSEGALRDPEMMKEFIAKERRVSEAIARQIRFTKDYEELGVKSAVWQDVGTLVRNAGASLPLHAIGLTIQCPGLEIFGDPLVAKVFYNLIDNSLKYGGEKMTRIRVTTHETDKALRIVYDDDGKGIPAEDKHKLFTKGFGKNTGLGLFFSREILAITGIAITETGEPGRGTRFEITVPEGTWRYHLHP